MNKKIIISMNLNTMNLAGIPRLSKEWLEYRISIFMRYTYLSLIKQTNQSFLAIVNYDILSYSVVNDILAKYPKLPDNILFTPINHIRPYEGFCENPLINESIKGYKFLYLTTLDTDNMYHPTFIDQLHNFTPKSQTECIINQNGYVYDVVDKRLGYWHSISPSFYTLIYDVDKYLSGFRYNIPDHGKAYTLKSEPFINENFLVTIHEQNARSKFNMYRLSKIIHDETDKKNILKSFNLSE